MLKRVIKFIGKRLLFSRKGRIYKKGGNVNDISKSNRARRTIQSKIKV